jgi:hypothetical protein
VKDSKELIAFHRLVWDPFLQATRERGTQARSGSFLGPVTRG